ncbi:Ubiquitin carboxyl-terminal hydrolase CYLD [Liparis tanakae]|uniref:ubiquitinyl hydrolase 1 n=1 Tax=Liparis tanakae TaxID=230148 RepID=A0A4Z2GG51_9TELE|nr:Ubiquitin carboxyl-terminal hydrolase CYLD [Liparis tanakae]
MEPGAGVGEKFFIVVRGKSRKGFCRGCVGRVQAELQPGELTGLLYGSSDGGAGSAGSPKSGGTVRREDTCPLTRHQAQLLLFVSTASKRLELLCNPQLFAAVCELSSGDLVVVKHRKGHLPAVVKNLMQIGKKEDKDYLQIGRKEDKDYLHLIGFQVEFVKPPSLALFSASDIIQVVPSDSIPPDLQRKEVQSGSLNRTGVMQLNAAPNTEAPPRQVRKGSTEQSAAQRRRSSTPYASLDLGSMVEVVSNSGLTVYGVVQWLGVPEGKTDKWAGIELEYDVKGCSDGIYGGQRYFTCKGSRALFVPAKKCKPDGRFVCTAPEKKNLNPDDAPPVPPFEESEEDAPPIPESEALSLLVGRMKGIQGHINSCYLDATLLSLFSTSVTLDNICRRSADEEKPVTCTLRKIVNRLRRQGFVPAESVMNFRKQLGCDTFRTEEKDPEEFITILFQNVLCMEPLLKLRECFICGHLAEYECLQCLPDRKLQPGRIKQYCSTCNAQVHTHPSRQGHTAKALVVPADAAASDSPVRRHTMQLFAVLCIHTSHYVSFVKCGPDTHSWLFFDSMADRCGDDHRGYSIPVIRACPELGDFLSRPEEELACSNPSQAPELVCRLLCDSYMFLYQNTAAPQLTPNQQES